MSEVTADSAFGSMSLEKALPEPNIEIRKIAKGEKNPPLEKIFTQSLLGDRRRGITVRGDVLNEYEKAIRNSDPKILTVIDFDGVLVSPTHLQKNAGVNNMLFLARCAKASDETVIWTNRIQPNKGKFADTGTFPFLGKNLIKRLEDMLNEQGKGKVQKKKLRDNSTELIEMSKGYDYIVFVGSSNIDRKVVKEFAHKDDMPERMVFFDTGHWII